jgi:hypothetical protein
MSTCRCTSCCRRAQRARRRRSNAGTCRGTCPRSLPRRRAPAPKSPHASVSLLARRRQRSGLAAAAAAAGRLVCTDERIQGARRRHAREGTRARRARGERGERGEMEERARCVSESAARRSEEAHEAAALLMRETREACEARQGPHEPSDNLRARVRSLPAHRRAHQHRESSCRDPVTCSCRAPRRRTLLPSAAARHTNPSI